MTNKLIIALLMASVIMNSCDNAKKSETESSAMADSSAIVPKNTNVPFTVAKGYFVKNTFNENLLPSPKIASLAAFESIFGYATVMGANGKPTPIDFTKQYVIAIVGKQTDLQTSIIADSITQKDNAIVLNYTITEGEKMTATIQPCLIAIVDTSYKGEVSCIQK